MLWRQRRLLYSRLSWFGGELSGGAISDYEPAESKVVTFECYWPETVWSEGRSSVSDSVTAVQIFRFKGVKVQVYRLFSPKEAVKCWILSA